MMNTLERARRYIAKCAPAISGQGGHDATFHVAAVLVHGFALPENDAMMLLREWNVACQPPWNERELLHKVASAATAQHAEARGHLLGDGTNGTKRTEWTAHAALSRAALPVCLVCLITDFLETHETYRQGRRR